MQMLTKCTVVVAALRSNQEPCIGHRVDASAEVNSWPTRNEVCAASPSELHHRNSFTLSFLNVAVASLRLIVLAEHDNAIDLRRITD